MPEKGVMKRSRAQVGRLWLIEGELNSVGPFVRRRGRALTVRRTATVAYPKTLTHLVHDLTLVCGDKLPVSGDGVGQAHPHRLQAGYIVGADRHRELGSCRVGDFLLAIILRKRAAALRSEDLRNDHTRSSEIAVTYGACRLNLVAISEVPHEAATFAVDKLLDAIKQRRCAIRLCRK